MVDAWRLSVGTLTALRVGHPSTYADSAAACSPSTTTTATTPAGPAVPDFITARERSRS